jgi:superfamily I DNA and/or RNA helicase
VAEFADELFNLMPCWMASPEAVSAIFPMEQLFDLVIFDEASQCFAERGIPAMYRGKQVVIAGDDKQLKPFELYQVRWTEDETEAPDLEVSSLLELTGRYLPTVHLQGHYRSQSLPLIEFSNKFFYEGRLKLLPDKEIINKQDTPITLHKVKGEWSNNTNLVEAIAVVDFALYLIHKFPEKEVGIITFNAPQQVMIMDLMEEKASRESLVIPSSLFIKNIENVQGDEKDIIIFSIGYAPDEKGKLSMQFGSLNVAGGENRLNVAVTRAREKIIVFSSIEPEELKMQGIKNEGPKLLKKYLEYARAISEDKFEGYEHQPYQYSSGWYLNRHLVNSGALKYPQLSFSFNEIPFADIAVREGKNYHGAVLTDDQMYQSSLTVKEPHAYTPALLEQKHWQYHRVFSRNWWSNQQRTEDELVKFIYQATES